jgi:F-type H+-transporting ATPase subunit b
MLIDWFTVTAQIVNFLILMWLLKRFLYKPILASIDAREKRIAAELADADARKAEAGQERDEFQRKNDEFERQRDQRWKQAQDEAEAERHRLLDEARQAAETLSAKRQDALRREQQSLTGEIRRRTREEVFAIARRTLKDLAGTSLEERVCEAFTHRLRALDHEAKEGLAKALKASSDPVRVRSAFDLPPEQQQAVQQAINETFSADVPVRFETAPDVISGIELTAHGQKVAWSIADYLASLEQDVEELLKQKDKAEAGAEVNAAESDAKQEASEYAT